MTVPGGRAEPSTLAPGQAPRGTVLVPEDLPTAIASARTEQALHLVVKNVAYEAPFRVDIAGKARPSGQGTCDRGAGVLLDRGAEPHRLGPVRAVDVEILVGDNATTVITAHDWDDDAVHIAQHHARVSRDARLKHVAVTLGGSAVRPNSIGEWPPPSAAIEKLGLYSTRASSSRTACSSTTAPSNCTSNVASPWARCREGRARSVGRRRADPQGGRGHQHLRASTATWCSPRAPAPTPCRTWRSRRARSRAPATPPPPGASTSSCSTCALAAFRRSRRAVWSCALFAEIIQQIDVPEVRERSRPRSRTSLARSMN